MTRMGEGQPASPGKGRKSLTVEANAAALLARYRADPPEGLRSRWIEPGASEASVLKAVFDIGLEAIEAEASDEGYRQLAVLWTHGPEREQLRAHQRERRARRDVDAPEAAIP